MIQDPGSVGCLVLRTWNNRNLGFRFGVRLGLIRLRLIIILLFNRTSFWFILLAGLHISPVCVVFYSFYYAIRSQGTITINIIVMA
jgi:hypothetical protein